MSAEFPVGTQTAGSEETTGKVPDSLIIVNLPDIHAYEHNPRRCPNQEYERIRASIRSRGLDQPLVITKRPGDSLYIPRAGGNTRLQILRELYAETGDEQYLSVRCLYKPWTTESEVLLAHLRENELRGSLTFIDKARAMLETKRVLASEMGDSEISQRRLAKLITERGLSVSHSMISKMSYAIDRLLPLIPQALSAGMGKPQVEKLNNLERMGRQLWQQYALGSDVEFDETFGALCRRYDSPDWDSDSLIAALEHEIAEASDTSLHVIRLQLSALIDGQNPVDLTHERADWQKEEMLSKPSGDWGTPEIMADEGESANPLGTDETQTGWTRDNDTVALPAKSDARLTLLRDRAYSLAAQLAGRNGLASAVTPLPGQGLGFLITDIPATELADTLDPTLLGQVSCLWWQLVACSELRVAPREAVLVHLAAGSLLHTVVSSQDADRLLLPVEIPDPGQWAAQLWRQLGDFDWRDLLQLMGTYRAIHKHANTLGIPLWE